MLSMLRLAVMSLWKVMSLPASQPPLPPHPLVVVDRSSTSLQALIPRLALLTSAALVSSILSLAAGPSPATQPLAFWPISPVKTSRQQLRPRVLLLASTPMLVSERSETRQLTGGLRVFLGETRKDFWGITQTAL